jgi:hypothetical protein
METVFLLLYMYKVVKMLGGQLVCVKYYLVLILFEGYLYFGARGSVVG